VISGGADINGDALHASLGLPPSLAVDTARVGKLQITVTRHLRGTVFFWVTYIFQSADSLSLLYLRALGGATLVLVPSSQILMKWIEFGLTF
jgi:hypothetical protein